MPSCRRRRRCRHHRTKKPLSSTRSEARDWAALPQDILLVIFLKLEPGQIIQGAELVCTAWRRVAVDEPMLWRRIDMGKVSVWCSAGHARARASIDRGGKHCEAFSGPCCDRILLYLVERAPFLKSLDLSSFHGPNEVLQVALKKLPLLEDLDIWPYYASRDTENLFESVCQACPLLKKLRLRFRNVLVKYYFRDIIMENFKGVVTTMCELRSLELFDCVITAEGLTAILDCCPVLEYLHITGCFDDEMDRELKAKCDSVKNLTLPGDEDYEWLKWLS